jgi:hypothetical protein
LESKGFRLSRTKTECWGFVSWEHGYHAKDPRGVKLWGLKTRFQELDEARRWRAWDAWSTLSWHRETPRSYPGSRPSWGGKTHTPAYLHCTTNVCEVP